MSRGAADPSVRATSSVPNLPALLQSNYGIAKLGKAEMRELWRRIAFLFRRADYERDLEEEMAHHLSMIEQDKHSEPAARRQFGNVTAWKEESRGMWTFAF